MADTYVPDIEEGLKKGNRNGLGARRNPGNRHGYPFNNCACSGRPKWHIRFEPMQHPAWKQVRWALAHQ
jgi:hypothetical protein